MSRSDESTPRPEPGFRPAGVGHAVKKNCMGCNTWSSSYGSKGSGLRYRCARCVAQAEGVTQ